MVFGRNTKQRLDRLHFDVAQSFAKVRDDTTVLHQWIQYLNAQNARQQQVINRLHFDQRHSVKRHEIAQVLQSTYPIDTHIQRVEAYENRIQRIEELLAKQQAQIEAAKSVPQIVSPVSKVSRTALQEKIVKNVGRQSKEYIKKTILSMLSKYDQITATSLRVMVVEEQRLCSRSSFYRLIDELETEGNLNAVSTGKERTLSRNRKVFKDL
jgi:hypothetical protein